MWPICGGLSASAIGEASSVMHAHRISRCFTWGAQVYGTVSFVYPFGVCANEWSRIVVHLSRTITQVSLEVHGYLHGACSNERNHYYLAQLQCIQHVFTEQRESLSSVLGAFGFYSVSHIGRLETTHDAYAVFGLHPGHSRLHCFRSVALPSRTSPQPRFAEPLYLPKAPRCCHKHENGCFEPAEQDPRTAGTCRHATFLRVERVFNRFV